MATSAVSDKTFDAEVKQSDKPVLVDFWAEWCGPCRTMGPVLDELSDELGDKIKVVKLDVDNNPAVAQAYNIRSIPALMLFKNGEVTAQKVGALPKQQLKTWINENVT